MAVTQIPEDVEARDEIRPSTAALQARLLQAVKRGDVASVSSVLGQAPDLLSNREYASEISFDGALWTPLGLAARLGHLDVVRLLLVKGADVRSACSGYMGRDQARKDACDFGSRYQPLHLAAMGKHPRVLRALLDAGAESTACDGSGCTPLYVAARQLSPECVQVLLDAGNGKAAVDVANSEDETPMMAALLGLHQAKEKGVNARQLRATMASACAVIARLLEAGAEPNDAEICDQITNRRLKYSNALLAALEYRMDDLAVLLHLHGGALPPASSGRPGSSLM